MKWLLKTETKYHNYKILNIFSIRGENMLKFIFKVVKKVIIGMILLFAYNTFLSSLNLMIPINVITIVVASLFDVPGIIGLAVFLLLNY